MAPCRVPNATAQKDPGPSKVIPPTNHTWLANRKRPPNKYTKRTLKNYFATVFSIFSNKMYPNRPYIKSLIALKVKQVNSFMEFMKDKTTDSLVPLIAIVGAKT